jgi:hypothetical protein
MDLGLKGKRALVTGSTAGIGLAVRGSCPRRWRRSATPQSLDCARRRRCRVPPRRTQNENPFCCFTRVGCGS